MERRKKSRFSAALATAILATLTIAVAASSAAVGKNVFWVDLSGQAAQHPKFVFFTANSGGQVHSLTWKRWGSGKTVGRGTFRDTAPLIPGQVNPDGKPAKIVAWKPVRCTPEFGNKEGKAIRVYRHVKLRYPNGDGGISVANVTDRAGWSSCK